MDKKKFVLNVLVSLIIAFITLNLFSLLYYNIPNRIEDSSESVDYKWQPNSFYSRGTEGFSWGKINNDGFNNLVDYIDGMPIDVLLMGSSHIEGFNVAQDENVAAILNKSTNYVTYNIGISEHTLLNCINNLESAIDKYNPSKYVIIETMNVSFYEDELQSCIDGANKLSAYNSSYLRFLENFKYLRLLFTQYNNTKGHNSGLKNGEPVNNEEMLKEVLSKAKNICDKHNLKLLIVYHPTLSFDNDGTVYANYNRDDYKIFETLCSESNIDFINMESTFIEEFKKNNVLPHGFNNTAIGTGHLNKYGHKMLAEEIEKYMEENDYDVQ